MSELLVVVLLTPLALAGLVLLPGRAGRAALRVAPWAAAPALVLALLPAGVERLDAGWLLLGAAFDLDASGTVFLLLTGLLWTIAGLYAQRYMADDERRRGFWFFFLLAMAGSTGMCLAADLVSLYLLFALMTFAAYPLVIHARTPEAYRAGRIYIMLAVVGEAMLLLALLLVVSSAGTLELAAAPAAVADSAARDAIVGLLLGGFGIKIGALPLHVWLPLAHPVAPTPASAVLSGAMIKAGLLGWLRFLPLGHIDLDGWGALLIGLGLGAAFFGVVIGITQRDAKIALAYSSISQMGLINIAIGAGLAEPAAWPAGQAAALTYALHHGLAKGALFLGVGVAAATGMTHRARRLVLAGMAVPALALAGAPLTSGAVAKLSLKDAAALAPPPWEAWLDILLPVAAIGTTLLMLRVLTILPVAGTGGARPPLGLWLPWTMLLAAVATVTLAAPALYGEPLAPAELLTLEALWINSWPIVVGIFVFGAVVVPAGLADVHSKPIVAGDLLVPIERALSGRLRLEPVVDVPAPPADPVASLGSRWYGLLDEPIDGGVLGRLEALLARWANAGALFMALVVVLLAVLLWR
jgi:formate hydrogenlyase subunit 3/multisubunit Na+/H+ antiporter MnhD subunit